MQRAKCVDELLPVVHLHKHRIFAARCLAKHDGMPCFQTRQDGRIIFPDVVRQELLARVVECPHRKDRVALIEDRLGHVSRALRDEQAAKTVLPALQNGASASRGVAALSPSATTEFHSGTSECASS